MENSSPPTGENLHSELSLIDAGRVKAGLAAGLAP
jgi:hypothetical protein